jgi:hypothetical protein
MSKTANTCQKPPKGWICGGKKGHKGPCAAYPADMVVPDIAWLLEAKLEDGAPLYLNHIVNGGKPILTTDVEDAIRFSREQDAQRIADDIKLTMGVLTPTEHVWL